MVSWRVHQDVLSEARPGPRRVSAMEAHLWAASATPDSRASPDSSAAV